jgi:hypothetical protein
LEETMNYGHLRRTAVARQSALESELREARATVSAAEKELKSLDQILAALKGSKGAALSTRRGKGKAKGRKGGKWRLGHPGRPPKWYTEKMKGKKGTESSRPAPKALRTRKKRVATPKMLAALARAREAMAAKRAAAAALPAAPG